MTYTPGNTEIVPPMVGPFTLGWGPLITERSIPSPPSSASWPSANVAVYAPVLVQATAVARRLWWANGSAVNASYNVDIGIYADNGYKPGTKLASSGGTAQGTASQLQFVDITDLTLPPGRYWIGMSCSTTSATFMRIVLASGFDAAAKFSEASAYPLPATATPVEATDALLILCGFATTASP